MIARTSYSREWPGRRSAWQPCRPGIQRRRTGSSRRADEINDLVHNREPANQRFQADHAEAVIGLGDLDRAERLVARLEARAAALPRPWILAIACRCRGMLHAARGDLDAAGVDYERALAAHQDLDMPAELGRTLVAIGRLHRRRNERRRAQECLERAVSVLEAAGAVGWAAVARDELTRARGRRGDSALLTATERTICELAGSGMRNHEIAALLFLSGQDGGGQPLPRLPQARRPVAYPAGGRPCPGRRGVEGRSVGFSPTRGRAAQS